jgi:hypothetical protein
MSELPPISLNAARERVIEALSNHFAQDDLSLEELERRLERAYKANTIAELDQLTADLRVAPAADSPKLPARAPVNAVPIALEHERIVSVMSESKRAGLWAVPQELDLLALMSDTTLDITHAQIPSGIVDIHVGAMMATVKLILPPGIHVVNRMHAFMSSVNNDLDEATPGPGAAVIRLSGWAVMAELKVIVRRREELTA